MNFATSAAGDVRIEIQDDRRPSPARLRGSTTPPRLIGNEIERAYAWKNSDDVSTLAGKPVRLRFVLRDADLFSFQFR